MIDSTLAAAFNITAWLLIVAALLALARRRRRAGRSDGHSPARAGVRRIRRLARRKLSPPLETAPAPPHPAGPQVAWSHAPRQPQPVRGGSASPEGNRLLDDRGARRLGSAFAERNRLRPAEEALPALIGQLDPDKWMAIWNFPVAGGHALVVLLGPNGAFVLAAGNGGFTPDDAERLTAAANGVQALLRASTGYTDPVRYAIVWPLENVAAKRWTVTGAAGASIIHTWAVGADTWTSWLHHYNDRGFTSADLRAVADATAAVAVEQYGPSRPSTTPERAGRG